jgi:hypothetical protein
MLNKVERGKVFHAKLKAKGKHGEVKPVHNQRDALNSGRRDGFREVGSGQQ